MVNFQLVFLMNEIYKKNEVFCLFIYKNINIIFNNKKIFSNNKSYCHLFIYYYYFFLLTIYSP